MTKEELNEIIEKHRKWLVGDPTGERANLRGVDLSGTSIIGVSLAYACLAGATIAQATIRGTNLMGATLMGSDLSGTIIRNTNLRGTNLRGAILRGTRLIGVNARDADLQGAYLMGATIEKGKRWYVPMTCPDTGAFIGWKIAGGLIVKLQIPEDARRSSATGRKCRCDKALVLAIENIDGTPAEVNSVCSDYSSGFKYKVGETVIEPAFYTDRFAECAPGIHFFINRQEAVEYNK